MNFELYIYNPSLRQPLPSNKEFCSTQVEFGIPSLTIYIAMLSSFATRSLLASLSIFSLASATPIIATNETLVQSLSARRPPPPQALAGLSPLQDPSKEPLVLILQGSFSPPHLGHLQTLATAIQHFESTVKTYEVVGAFLSPERNKEKEGLAPVANRYVHLY